MPLSDDAGWGTKDRIAGPLSLIQQDSDSTQVLQHSLELNSARALSLNSCHQEAVDKFRALDASGRCHAFVKNFPNLQLEVGLK